MSNPEQKPPPSYAPVYAAAIYPDLATICRQHGYALAVHGSLARDFDLIAVPWAENVSAPREVVDAILNHYGHLFSGFHEGEKATPKNHGRVAYTLIFGWGNCFLDLSFFPAAAPRSRALSKKANP